MMQQHLGACMNMIPSHMIPHKLGSWAESEVGRASKAHPSAFASRVTDIPVETDTGGVQFTFVLPPDIRVSPRIGENQKTALQYLENIFGKGNFVHEVSGAREVIVTLPADQVPFFNALMVEEHSHDGPGAGH